MKKPHPPQISPQEKNIGRNKKRGKRLPSPKCMGEKLGRHWTTGNNPPSIQTHHHRHLEGVD